MEKELLEMSRLWKKTALEMLEKSEPASRLEFANQMLLACAEMLEWKFNGLQSVGVEVSPPPASRIGAVL
ncbi:MAG TPA: hypothetical protein VJY15_08745 [Candidatus Acidoferrum sp.]|nr:hypothetical protein [Candidatus Acidoferrum sp.]